MVSHKKVGGIELSIGGGGLRFKKRKSAFNVCVGKAMEGKKPIKGRYDTAFQLEFGRAAQSCGTPRKTLKGA